MTTIDYEKEYGDFDPLDYWLARETNGIGIYKEIVLADKYCILKFKFSQVL
ncbi:hypothetical protein [Campylobacter concisus]|uniref:hypothetical protein n=1 Tax=Campylobacter concisus TaxID=199 RepID=UPI0015E1AD29|nr:hypothetical protein [Campylobacter concisus]